MTVHTLLLTGIALFFGSFFVVMMYVWITTNLHQAKQAKPTVQSIPARRPEAAPLKQAA